MLLCRQLNSLVKLVFDHAIGCQTYDGVGAVQATADASELVRVRRDRATNAKSVEREFRSGLVPTTNIPG